MEWYNGQTENYLPLLIIEYWLSILILSCKYIINNKLIFMNCTLWNSVVG